MIDYKGNPFFLSDKDIAWVEDTWASMTTAEKVGQLFCMVGYNCDRAYLEEITQKRHAGAFMCRAMDIDELLESISCLQENSRIPMLISANIESGGNGILVGGTKLSSPMGIAATNDPGWARRLGEVCGKEGFACGASWTYSPVIDIDFNFRNPITNTRTFGSDPERVARMGEEYIRALQKHGLAAAAKHFPGDGVDERDQHLVTTVNSLSVGAWEESYGMVYRRCIEAGVKTIMAGHIMQPAWSRRLRPGIKDGEIMPATLSPELISGLLRGELGFNGVVATDATAMAGMNLCMPRDRLVPAAIAAGCDIFTFTRNMDEDFEYMYRGIEDGVITPGRLEEAVKRVLALKASLRLHERQAAGTLAPKRSDVEAVLEDTSFSAWARECADESITLVKEEAGVLPVSPEKTPRILLYDISGGENAVGYGAKSGAADRFSVLLEGRGYRVERFSPAQGMEGMMGSFRDFTERYDLVIYLANLATKSNQTTVRIEWRQPMGADIPIYLHSVPTIFVSLENPYHLLDVPRVRTYINTYSSDDAVLALLLEKLEGMSAFKGQSPSDPFCGKWDARL